MIQVWADGSITGGPWGNKFQRIDEPIPTIWGGWFAKHEDGTHIHHDSHNFGTRDTNSSTLAEYFAVRSALYWLGHNGYASERVTLYNDNQTCVRQLTGEYQCKNEGLKVMLDSCKRLEKKFLQVTYEWRRREMMQEADVLSKALQIWGYVPTWDEVQERLAARSKKKARTKKPVR